MTSRRFGRSRRVALAALCATALATASAARPQEPSAGALKLPAEIFDFYRIASGYSGGTLLHVDTYSIGGTIVNRKRCERAAPTDPWTCLRAAERTSYFITGFETREGGDEAYVAGIRQDGNCLIERWTAEPRQGGWIARIGGSTPLGQPLPPAVPVLSVEGGGPWTAPSAVVQSLPPVVRRTVYETPDGPLHGLGVDPQGRYLVFYDMGRNELMQLDLTASPPVASVLGAPATHPTLDQVGSIQVGDFAGQGRKLLVRREYNVDFHASREKYTIFSDATNDGIFEASLALERTQWQASPYSTWSDWNLYWDE